MIWSLFYCSLPKCLREWTMRKLIKDFRRRKFYGERASSCSRRGWVSVRGDMRRTESELPDLWIIKMYCKKMDFERTWTQLSCTKMTETLEIVNWRRIETERSKIKDRTLFSGCCDASVGSWAAFAAAAAAAARALSEKGRAARVTDRENREGVRITELGWKDGN